MTDFPIFEAELEIRAKGGRRSLRGKFRYGSTATIADRGRVRKERFEPRAFQFAVDDPEREIHLLRGHSFDQPLASKRNGSLVLRETDDALEFEAILPDAAGQPTYMADTVRMVEAGLMAGVSPGFRVPPATVVPDAERLEPEPGNPGVQIRVIRAAVLSELSLVTRPAYPDTEAAVRAMQTDLDAPRPARRTPAWL